MTEDDRGGEAPCTLHLLEPDAETRRDVARWRRAERARLIAARMALSVAARQLGSAAIARELDALIGAQAGATIAIAWPFRGEPDLRPWSETRRAAGARIALPVVLRKGAPLVFRLWTPGMRLVRGVWDIPIPPEDAPACRPDIVIAPVVGLDDAGFRLGYGGGFYDRTLAQLSLQGGKPLTVGVGFACQRIPTIFPLPHDIAMDKAVMAPA